MKINHLPGLLLPMGGTGCSPTSMADGRIRIPCRPASTPRPVVLVSRSGHDWPGKHWSTGTFDPATGKQTDKYDQLYPVDDASKKWYTGEMVKFYADNVAGGPRGGTSGNFKCQLTDVETEANGMLSYDRAVWKVDPEAVAASIKAANAANSGR